MSRTVGNIYNQLIILVRKYKVFLSRTVGNIYNHTTVVRKYKVLLSRTVRNIFNHTSQEVQSIDV